MEMIKKVEDSLQMGIVKIPKLILKISIPLMAALLVNTLYNMVDSIFVAQLNEKALAALSLAAPIQVLIAALGAGMAVGLNAVISKALGEQNNNAVKKTASAAIFLAICSYLLIFLASFTLLEPFFTWQTADKEIAAYGISYLRVCMGLSFGCMLQWVFDRFLIATGKTHLFMITLATGSVINIILDPIFIFGYFGLPPMGTAGAGLATVIGQIIAAVISILLNIFWNKEIPIRFTFKPQSSAIINILRVGIPTAIMQGIASIVGMIINILLIGFSSTAVAVYGICIKIQNVFLIVPHGINNAIIPIIAYNYGAKNSERQKQSFCWAMVFSMIFMLFATLLLQLFPKQILLWFNASAQMLAIGTTALRTLSIATLISVYGLILCAVLQALGDGKSSMFLTISRQGIFLLPLIFIFCKMDNLPLVWAAFVFAETLGIFYSIYLHKKINYI